MNKNVKYNCGKQIFSNRYYFNNANELLKEVEKKVVKTDVVLDIGCGIMPMNYYRPELHIMLEPWYEYVDILSERYKDDKSIVIIKDEALNMLQKFSKNSVDSIFLLDVIEHIDKEIGKLIIKECERVARNQIILFTPLGFMSQKHDKNEKDGWGLNGIAFQNHISGWHLDEFNDNWELYICENFHKIDFKGDILQNPHGAFFGILNLKKSSIKKPDFIPNIKKILPSEKEVQILKEKFKIQKNLTLKYKEKYEKLLNK